MLIVNTPVRRQRSVMVHKSMLKKPFPGAKLFQLKATHGIPLENSLDLLMNQQSLKIDWVGFIDEARKNEWWDFQIVEAVEQAMVEAVVERRVIEAILLRMRVYMLDNRHPAMEQK